jgi:hypothetical protein
MKLCNTHLRKKALTPMIAGSVCGGLMGIAWIIGFSIYFYKRYKRKKLKRKVAAGLAAPKQKKYPETEKKIIIPPDPAILLGHRLPGEPAFKDEKHSGSSENLTSAKDTSSREKGSGGSSSDNSHKALTLPAHDRMDVKVTEEMTIPRHV